MLVGAAWSFGLLGALSFGIFLLPVTLMATWQLARRDQTVRHIAGVLSGVGAPLLYLAYLNRSGPGVVCAGDRCEQQMTPWPWLWAGLSFVLAGIAAYVLLGRWRRSR